jgi:hypothetical protein
MSILRFLRNASRRVHSLLIWSVHSYLFSFDHVFALGLFTAAVVALITHKLFIIQLHQPLPEVKLHFAYPFLFVFDVVTLAGLHRGLNAAIAAWRILASGLALIVISCSAAFASLYFEGNAELNWGRSVEVSSIDAVLMIGHFRLEVL